MVGVGPQHRESRRDSPSKLGQRGRTSEGSLTPFNHPQCCSAVLAGSPFVVSCLGIACIPHSQPLHVCHICRSVDPSWPTPTDRQSYGSPMECLGFPSFLWPSFARLGRRPLGPNRRNGGGSHRRPCGHRPCSIRWMSFWCPKHRWKPYKSTSFDWGWSYKTNTLGFLANHSFHRRVIPNQLRILHHFFKWKILEV